MDKPRPEVVKVDLRVQVAKDDLQHQSLQLHLDMVLQAKTERQYSITANTAGYHPVMLMQMLMLMLNAKC